MKITIKPKTTDLKVIKPDGSFLNPEGETLVKTTYWLRRIKDGDVIIVQNNETTTTTTTTTTTSKKEK